MRAVVQRVTEAAVSVSGQVVGKIQHGALVYVSIAPTDTINTATRMANKITQLALFPDSAHPIAQSLQDLGGQLLLVSQFTLHADLSKGKRPSFSRAASPEHARSIYGQLKDALRSLGVEVATGQFGANMRVESSNDGPVTILLEIDE